MSAIETASDQCDDRVLNDRHAGPTVARMVLGARLRRLREAAGITREKASEAIRGSDSKISRLELGRIGSKRRDVADLLTCYGVTDEAERATVLGLVKQANTPGWWHPYSDVVPSWLHAYLGLEQAASVIRSYEIQFVPGLLQTRDYARAVIMLAHGDAPKTQIERRLDLRMKRQQILHRPQAPHLWAVIDEAALRRPINGAATMRAQLRHLIDICDLPHITIQVMAFHAGGHAAAGGPITLLRLPERELPDTAYLEQLTNAHYPDKSADIDYYWHIMNRLVTEAEPANATPQILTEIIAQT